MYRVPQTSISQQTATVLSKMTFSHPLRSQKVDLIFTARSTA